MSESRHQRALNAARIRLMPGKDRTLLSSEAIDDVCRAFLAYADPKLLAQLEQLQREVDARGAKP